MKVKILIDNDNKELDLPIECDYGVIVKDDIIVSLVLPILDDKVVPKEYIERIVLNQTLYSELLAKIKK